jgi:hypothetical protein
MTEAQATFIAAIIAGVAALIGAVLSFLIAKSQRQQDRQIADWQRTQDLRIEEWQQKKKADELFLTALEFLGGGTQKRNLGIAAIRLYWKEYPQHRLLCLEFLIGSAIYLLAESDQKDAAHEVYNLKRIMNLIFVEIPYERDAYYSYSQLKALLAVWKPKVEKEKGLHLNPHDVEEWKRLLDDHLPSGPSKDA